MCLNCGCQLADDDMGNKDNITLTTVAKASIASNMTGQDTLKQLKASLDNLPATEVDKKIAGLKVKK